MFSHSLTNAPVEASLESISESVIHWTEGRIRLRIPWLGHEWNGATNLERSLKAYPFVRAVSFNVVAHSVTIHYDANQISAASFRTHLMMALRQAITPMAESYTTRALAQRLGVPFQSLNWRRSQVDFAEWSRTKDPQGFAWKYDAGAKCFYSCTAPHPEPAESGSSKVERIFHGLMGATGSRLGGLLGKVAGEAIGLALLGTAGVIVGAEIGMMIGEIVGEELGSV